MSSPGETAETEQQTGQGALRRNTNPPVLVISLVVILAFLLAGVLNPEGTMEAASAAQDFVTTNFGWFYILSASLFVVFAIGVMLSRYGRLRLGPDDSEPEYRTVPWFAMLFTAGMGIGLVFFGVAESPDHLANAPFITGDGQEAASDAMRYTLFHWGLHPWAIYIVIGLALGYACFRKGLPLRPASGLYALIGDRIYGWWGHVIDVLAVFGTMFGLATSLGLGAQQVNAGLSEVFGIPVNPNVQLAVVAFIAAIAIVSVFLGIDKGLRRLSVLNLGLALVLMLAIFAAGPKLFILSGLADYTGAYLQNLVGMSFEAFDPGTQGDAAEWQSGWTLFYWGWWMSWSPFVGMFIARISYGRTIRQFIGGTLFAPVGASIVWFSVLGGTGLQAQLEGLDIAAEDEERALFLVLDYLPLGGFLATLLGLLTVLVVAIFFATSADSGSLVLNILSNGGNPETSRLHRALWGILAAAVAAVLLWIGGELALEALQTASIVAGLPFAVVLLFLCVGMMKAFKQESMAAAPSSSRLASRSARRHDRVEGEPVDE